MSAKQRVPIVVSWLGILVSVAFAIAAIWSYAHLQMWLESLTQSADASITGISESAERTAVTVESSQKLFEETAKMMSATQKFVDALRAAAENQTKLAPQYVEGLQESSALGKQAGETMQTVGTALQTLAALSHYRPLESRGRDLVVMAQKVMTVSGNLATISNAVGQDASKISGSFIAASNQANVALASTQEMLERIKSLDLPQTARVLRKTSEELRRANTQIKNTQYIAIAFLVIGLLLATWCFLNSLATLALARSSQASHLGRTTE